MNLTSSVSGNQEPTPWLVATGQRRKLVAAKVLALTGGMAWVASWFGSSLGVPARIIEIASYLGQGLVILGLLVLVFSISCPQCKARPASAFMTKSSVGRWLFDLEDATSCPSCGHYPNEAHRK